MSASADRAATPDRARTSAARLLIVDNEAGLMQALCDTLGLEGYETTGCASPSAALDKLRAETFDLLVTDLMMPEMDGIALLRAAQELDPDISGVIMTGHATIDTAVGAMKAGAYDYIVKPFRLGHVLPVVSRAVEARRLRRLNRALEQRVLERTRALEAANRDLERANRELELTNGELGRANRDLESFSYSVSHDLRAPLRAIRGYCDLLTEEYATGLPADAQRLLEQVVAGASRMDQLIADLLRLARFSRQPLELRRVSMNALVGEVASELRRQNPQRNVEIGVEDLIECYGDTTLLRQVLVNLLSNAFKFTAGRDPARIEVGCSRDVSRIVYHVSDNGAGFDMKYAGKLFGVFQRLHSRSEFEGTGIGLSIVQRIIERHGGAVWAEGRSGEGATFHFALPAAEPDAVRNS